MALSTGQIAQLLLPGLRAVKGDYQEMASEWSLIYSQGRSDLATEKTAHVRLLGLPALKGQGQATEFDLSSGVRFIWNHNHLAVGLGYAFTREALDDNLYKTQFNPTNLGLRRSFRQFKEILGADVFNNGTIFNPAVGGDGVALFSSAHPTDFGNVSNIAQTPIGLNEASLESACNQIRRFRDYAGLLMSAQGEKLLVPTELRHVAKRLIETELRPGTANNDINALKDNGDLAKGFIANDFLTNPYSWFVLSDVGGLIYLERVAFEIKMQTEFTTDNLLVKAYERYYIGWDDWRCAWGSFPNN